MKNPWKGYFKAIDWKRAGTVLLDFITVIPIVILSPLWYPVFKWIEDKNVITRNAETSDDD